MSLLSELGTIAFDRPVIAATLTPRLGEPFSIDQWIDIVPDIFKPAAIAALERVLPNFDGAPESPEDIHKMAAFIALEIRTLVDTRALTREGFADAEDDAADDAEDADAPFEARVEIEDAIEKKLDGLGSSDQ